MSLTEHAKRELELAGLLGKGSDYDGMIGEAVLELVEKFAAQGHSGASAAKTVAVFSMVAAFKPLTPLTYKPEEWNDVSEHGGGKPMWQNKRNSAIFSVDEGKTHYDVNDVGKDKAEVKPKITEVIVGEGAFEEGDTLVMLNPDGQIKDLYFGKGKQPSCIREMLAEETVDCEYPRKNSDTKVAK